MSSHSPTALLRTRHQNSNSILTHVDLTGAPTNRPIWTPRATPTRRQTVAVASARAEELSVPNYLTACPLTAGIRDRATRPLAAVLPTLRIPGLGATRQRVVLASPITAGNKHLLLLLLPRTTESCSAALPCGSAFKSSPSRRFFAAGEVGIAVLASGSFVIPLFRFRANSFVFRELPFS